jgi:hypothetical protein
MLPNGKRRVLVALPDDELGSLFERLGKIGGTVNVAVPVDDGLAVIVFTPSPDKASDLLDDCPIGRTSAVGMLLSLLRSTGKATRCRLTEPNYEAELVDDATRVPSPS